MRPSRLTLEVPLRSPCAIVRRESPTRIHNQRIAPFVLRQKLIFLMHSRDVHRTQKLLSFFSGRSREVFDAPQETVAKPSLFAISAAGTGAPIWMKRLYASRSSRSRVA